MRRLRLSTGHEIDLDGDLHAVLDGLARGVGPGRRLASSAEHLIWEIESLVQQMDDRERRLYLTESPFRSSLTHRSGLLDTLARKSTRASPKRSARRGKRPPGERRRVAAEGAEATVLPEPDASAEGAGRARFANVDGPRRSGNGSARSSWCALPGG